MKKEIKLSDGRIATVRRGKGKQSREALKQSGQDSGKYMAAFMAQCTSIQEADGTVTLPTVEVLDDLWANDYQALMAAFSEINFPEAVAEATAEENTSQGQ